MTKLLILCSLSLFFVSCNHNSDCASPALATVQKEEALANHECSALNLDSNPELNSDPGPDNGEVPNEALTFDISAKLFEFDTDDEVKVEKAFEIIKKVVASKEFRDKVLNFTYQDKKQFVDNNGKTNAQIYQILLDGREDLKPEVDNQMDLELQLYYSLRSTVGYTTPGELRIYLNTKFFDPYTPSEVAGNVFHEWIHKLGFNHDSTYSVPRDSSVPYAIGSMIEELGKQYE